MWCINQSSYHNLYSVIHYIPLYNMQIITNYDQWSIMIIMIILMSIIIIIINYYCYESWSWSFSWIILVINRIVNLFFLCINLGTTLISLLIPLQHNQGHQGRPPRPTPSAAASAPWRTPTAPPRCAAPSWRCRRWSAARRPGATRPRRRRRSCSWCLGRLGSPMILGKLWRPHCLPSLESWLGFGKSSPNGRTIQVSEIL